MKRLVKFCVVGQPLHHERLFLPFLSIGRLNPLLRLVDDQWEGRKGRDNMRSSSASGSFSLDVCDADGTFLQWLVCQFLALVFSPGIVLFPKPTNARKESTKTDVGRCYLMGVF